MEKEFESKKQVIGLEEINQEEISEVNGGGCIIRKPNGGTTIMTCLFDIPPMGQGPYPFPWGW